MNKRNFVNIFLVIIFLVAICVYWLRLGFDVTLLREGLYLSTSLLAAIGGIFSLCIFGLKGSRAMTLLFLTAGISYWFFGDVIFDYYQYVLQISPFPSVADAFYLLAYPFLLVGLINEAVTSTVNWRKMNKRILLLLVLTSLLFAGIVCYFGVYKAYNPAETFFANMISMSYGFGDLLLILASMLVLILVWEFRGGKLSRVWLLLFIGFIMTLIADILYAIYTDQYTSVVWFYKSLVDTFFMGGYLLFAGALFEFGISIVDAFALVGEKVHVKRSSF